LNSMGVWQPTYVSQLRLENNCRRTQPNSQLGGERSINPREEEYNEDSVGSTVDGCTHTLGRAGTEHRRCCTFARLICLSISIRTPHLISRRATAQLPSRSLFTTLSLPRPIEGESSQPSSDPVAKTPKAELLRNKQQEKQIR
jgi:hypothetical protein